MRLELKNYPPVENKGKVLTSLCKLYIKPEQALYLVNRAPVVFYMQDDTVADEVARELEALGCTLTVEYLRDQINFDKYSA